tara:strand:- start:51 stop:761 length:711 start_codon:yes stop_codon:yes gene_type:complete
MVNTEMKNAFNAFNTSEPMNWAPSNTKQNEAKKAHNEALKAAVKRSKAQANAKKAALRKKENEKAYREAVKRSKAQANAEKAARRKKEEANLKKAQEKAYKEAAKRSKDQANKARNERARVRAQKKEEENRKKKEEENRKKKTNAERRASNASTNKNKPFWKIDLNKIKNSNMTKEQKLKEGKKVYKKAALKLHPNKGGKKEDFQEFSNFYSKFKENPYPEIKPRKQPRNFGGYQF